MFKKIVNFFNRKVLSTIAAFSLIFVMAITGIDVFGRYVLGKPLIGAFELSELCMATIVFLGWGFTQSEKFHIEIDVVYNKMPELTKKILNVLMPILGLALFFFMGWQSIIFIKDSMALHETTDMLGLPVWPIKSFMLIGSVAMVLQFFIDLIENCSFKECE